MEYWVIAILAAAAIAAAAWIGYGKGYKTGSAETARDLEIDALGREREARGEYCRNCEHGMFRSLGGRKWTVACELEADCQKFIRRASDGRGNRCFGSD